MDRIGAKNDFAILLYGRSEGLIVLLFAFTTIAATFLPHDVLEQVNAAKNNIPGNTAQTSEMMQTLAAVCITWGFFHAGLRPHQVVAGIVLIAAVAMVQRVQACPP